ncbi:FecR family protein [Mucilaginibacter sp. SG564]|uniref:FecR family protein n=1 Tax=Mucilaginibacter sp. SG564 TaxID=2587022 RepID=UPI001555B0ED|nr:FecR family protein [Mucilaginibacter sp. SG564]NOW94990.1 hypothetical protein [Mucilaginibacter sp. SG564]
MKKKVAKVILAKYKSGEVSKEEGELVDNWFFNKMASDHNLTDEELLNDLTEIRQRFDSELVPHRKAILWPRFAAAAAILIFIGAAFFYSTRPGHTGDHPIGFTKTDILPGGNKATLTLANGKVVVLNDAGKGTVARESGVNITKNAQGEITYLAERTDTQDGQAKYNTTSTPRGGQWHLTLADGTHVWLNAASAIRYPTAFSGKSREVELDGEAYFEVAHNASMPFKVISKGQTVEVLGTHFNINSYPDEPSIKTTLLEGKVKVYSNESAYKILLPGQEASNSNSQISVTDADTEAALAWKNNRFQFTGSDIKGLMRQFARWYDVDVQYQGDIPEHEFTGRISRNVRASDVFEILKKYQLNFKIEGKKVTVSNK